ncbi:MAG: helix-turn-helix transcriptional regulator [Ruminococcus sp.]|nr:helix-turn-helix transcriptional regulator [Ruminococcus sp.]
MSKSTKISKMNEIKYIQLGLNISYYRKLRGYTQEELAELAGISRSHISAIEAPNIIRNVSLEVLFNLSEALNIAPYKLLEFKE